ncbi:MAG: hypothetical protein Q9170_004999 [Blastenia crenularia]
MSRVLSAIPALAINAVASYAGRKSYIAIVSLRKYEERSERAAKHSETAAHELYKTRVTQASSAAAITLSFLSSVVLLLRSMFGSRTPSMTEFLLLPLNLVGLAAAFVHNQDFWKAKAKVPFVGGFNEGIEKSKEIRQLMVLLSLAWVSFGVLQWFGK